MNKHTLACLAAVTVLAMTGCGAGVEPPSASTEAGGTTPPTADTTIASIDDLLDTYEEHETCLSPQDLEMDIASESRICASGDMLMIFQDKTDITWFVENAVERLRLVGLTKGDYVSGENWLVITNDQGHALADSTSAELLVNPGAPEDGGTMKDLQTLIDSWEGILDSTCNEVGDRNMVTLADASVACGTDTVLSTYSSSTSKESMIQNYKDLEVGESSTWLVGENWIINTPKSNIPSLATYLGGSQTDL